MAPGPTTPDQPRDAGVAKVAELVKDATTCMLTTSGEDGKLVSRPMAVQEVEFDGDLWFATDGGSSKVAQVRHGSHVNVSFADGDAWLSLAGDAEVVKDDAKAEELWNPALGAWFPDGPRTPGLVLLKIHAASAEYWDNPGSKVTTLLSFVKAKATGERFRGGENETVEL